MTWITQRFVVSWSKCLEIFQMLSSYIMVALFEKNISSTIQERRVRAKDLEKALDKMLSLQVGEKY